MSSAHDKRGDARGAGRSRREFSVALACGGLAGATAWAALATGLGGCAGSPDAGRSRVARVRPVERTGVAEYDEFFAVVYQMQVALNEFERVRVTLLADLADAMRLASGADLEAVSAAVHDRAMDYAQHDVRIVVDLSPEEPTASGPPPRVGGAPTAASNARAVFPRPQPEAAAHAAVEVRTEGAAAVPPEVARLVTAVRTALRNALGLRSRMEEIVTFAPQIIAAGRALAATVDRRAPPDQRAALRAEFRDALEFLNGAGPRARAQAQISQRIAVRLQSSASVVPGGDGDDDDGDGEGTPSPGG